MLIQILSPRRQAQAFLQFSKMLKLQQELIFELTRRELLERHAGQIAGSAWTVITPFVTIAVYVTVFTAVFSPRGSQSIPEGHYPLFLLSGLVPWLLAQDVLGKSVRVVVDNAALVKQVIFPVEVLPLKSTLAALVSELIMLSILLPYAIVVGRVTPFAVILVVLVPIQMLFLFGIAYVLAAVGVFLRDTRELVGLFLGFGMFVAPVPYAPEALPRWLVWILGANPFSYMVWCFQDALYFGEMRHPLAWVVFPLLSLFLAAFGYRVFRNLAGWFGELL